MRIALLLALALATACGGRQQPNRAEPTVETEAPEHVEARDTDAPIGPAETEPTPLERLIFLDPVLDGYDRKAWKHWTDEDGDCQDTRQEVLIEESEIPVTFKDTRECKVATGRWTCPYTGEVFTDPRKLDVDHMVPLGAAHAAGGHAWAPGRRQAFANELGVAHHLIAVKASANRSKGKKGPEEWLPPNASYVCEYVRTWGDIKVQWELAVTAGEKALLERELVRCAGEGKSNRY